MKLTNDKILCILVGLVIGIVGMLIITNYSPSNTENKGMMSSQASTVIDAHFIEQMIPHHEDAITMSELALTKAQKPEIKKLAENIILSQSKEIEQMKEWYKEWYGKDLPTGENVMEHHGMGSDSGMHMGMTGTQDDISNLENAADFDIAFIEHMIPHHQMAVMMASMLKNGTERPEMKKLADDIITTQTKEIEQMREWLKEWSQ